MFGAGAFGRLMFGGLRVTATPSQTTIRRGPMYGSLGFAQGMFAGGAVTLGPGDDPVIRRIRSTLVERLVISNFGPRRTP